MPYHLHALPVTATSLSIRHKGETYPLLLDTDTFDRTGEDGDIPIIPLNGGCEFVGEVLPAEFHKCWDDKINTFTATIDSGILRLTGFAKNAGIVGRGWINSHHPLPMLDDLEVTVSMEVPVDDSGVTAARDIFYEFYIKQDKDEIDPFGDNNYLVVYYDIDEEGLKLYIKKRVNGAAVETLASGKDYNMASDRGVGDLEATIWRFVFNGKPGTVGATLGVYLKQSNNLANAESATEHEVVDAVTGEPFDISDLAFNVGYPCYAIYTQNATYFGTAYDSANRAASGYLRVTYPSQFNVNYNYTEANYGETDVQLWDGDPDAGGIRVYDEDHMFSGKRWIRNGLAQITLEEAATGMDFYVWDGTNYTYIGLFKHYDANLLLNDDSPSNIVIKTVTPERVIVDFDLNTSTQRMTMTRGNPMTKFVFRYTSAANNWIRIQSIIPDYGFTQDNDVMDRSLAITVNTNDVYDNFALAWDNVSDWVLVFCSKEKAQTKIDLAEYGWGNIDFKEFTAWFGSIPFAYIVNLFEEAEDATLGAGTARLFTDPTGASTFVRAQSSAAGDITQTLTIIGDTATGRQTDTIALNGAAWVNGSIDFTRVYVLHLSAVTAGNITVQGSDAGAVHIIPIGTTHVDNCVILNAQTEYVRHDFIAGTDLPAGRYLAALRISDLNQVADDVELKVTNFTDNEQRGEQGKPIYVTAAATYGYFCEFFDITDTDVSTLDSMRITVTKDLATGNEIYVDYFLIIPIGDGMNWSQDLAHGAIRGITQHPRLSER